MTFGTTSTPMGGETITVTYEPIEGLGWLGFKNWLLSIVTLGIYRFWAKTNVRKHVWSCVKINGEPLEYTGKGMELFLGAIIIFFIIFLPFMVIVNGLQLSGYPGVAAFAQLAFMLLFLMLWGMAVYRARRYRLSRTLWRGVRGTLVGSPMGYSMLHFGTSLLSGVTMGWSNPAMNLELQGRITNEMRFGETPFTFKGRAGPLYGRYAASWFATLFFCILAGIAIFATFSAFGAFDDGAAGDAWREFWKAFNQELENGGSTNATPDWMVFATVFGIYVGIAILAVFYGIIWSFYTAREMSVFASYTGFDNATFKLNATTWSLVWLWMGNILLIIFTLGIATPFTVQRLVRYLVDRLEVHGWVDVGKIEQSRAPVDSVGEGLLDAFEIDGI